MIEFIFFISIVAYLLLFFSIFIESYPLGAISAMAIMIVGVSVLSNGIAGIDNLLTLSFGTISFCIGGYVLVLVGLEQIKELNI